MANEVRKLRAAYSPDASRIVTAGADGSVSLWSADGSSPMAMADHHGGAVNDVKFSPKGEFIVSASDDKTVVIWRSSDGSVLKRLKGHTKKVRAVSFNSAGLYIVSASDDRTAWLWEVNGDRNLSLVGHEDHVFGALFSPDGSRILTFSEDATARLWKADIDRVEPIGRPMKHDEWVMSAAFNSRKDGGSEIVTASGTAGPGSGTA